MAFDKIPHNLILCMMGGWCDDSKGDREELRALLEAYGQDFEIREYGSGKSLCGDMEFVRECGIIFLDINMEGMDGLEATRQIKAECPKVHIVLVTAYVNYALDGYKVKASCFLLKDDLERILQECMDDILRKIRQEDWVVEFGFVEGNLRLRVDDINYIETIERTFSWYIGNCYNEKKMRTYILKYMFAFSGQKDITIRRSDAFRRYKNLLQIRHHQGRHPQ